MVQPPRGPLRGGGLRSARARALALAALAAGLGLAVAAAWSTLPPEIVRAVARPEAVAPALADGRLVRQELPRGPGGLAAIEVSMVTYGKVADGTLEAELVATDADGAERTLARWTRDAASIEDNAWHRLTLDAPLPVPEPPGERLALTLRRPEPGGRPLGLREGLGDLEPDAALTIDGQPRRGDLALHLVYRPGPLAAARYRLGAGPAPPALAFALLAGMVAAAVVAVGAMWAGGRAEAADVERA